MRPIRIVVMILVEAHFNAANNSCHLPSELTADNLDEVSRDCVEFHGNLKINSSISIYETNLTSLFEKTTRLFGCVFIQNPALESFSFLKNLESIECPDNEGNVLELRCGDLAFSLGFQSLKRIEGPGGIILERATTHDKMGWTCLEFQLFINHPQFRGRTFLRLERDESSCEPRPPLFEVPPRCQCMGNLILSTGSIYEPQMENLNQIRVIFGMLRVSRTLLHNISFLGQLQYIVNQDNRGYRTVSFADNVYLSDIELPNLRSVMTSFQPFVLIRNCPLLPDIPIDENISCNLYGSQYEHGILVNQQSCEFVQPQPLPFRRIVSGDNQLGASFFYHFPIGASLLLNLRVLTYWIFGFFRRDFKILQLLIILQTFSIMLIQVDNLLFYQRIMLPTFSLFSTFSFDIKFVYIEPLIKFQVSFRDLMLYIPHAVYCSAIAEMLIGRKYGKIAQIWEEIIFVSVLFGAYIYMMSRWNSLAVEFIQPSYDTSNFLERELPLVQRLPYYIKVTDITYVPMALQNPAPKPYESMDYENSFGQENNRPFFEADDQRFYFLSELHTDGWMFNRKRLLAEIAVLAIAIIYHSAYYCMPRLYGMSDTRRIAVIVLMQHFLMRYPSIRTTIWHSKTFPLACYTENDVRPDWEIFFSVPGNCLTSEYTAFIWNRAIYFGMVFVALFALKIAKIPPPSQLSQETKFQY